MRCFRIVAQGKRGGRLNRCVPALLWSVAAPQLWDTKAAGTPEPSPLWSAQAQSRKRGVQSWQGRGIAKVHCTKPAAACMESVSLSWGDSRGCKNLEQGKEGPNAP